MATIPANDSPLAGMTGLYRAQRQADAAWTIPEARRDGDAATFRRDGRTLTGFAIAGRLGATDPRCNSGSQECHGTAIMQALRPLGSVTSLKRGRHIFCQGEPIRHWYWLASGAVQLCTFSKDGKRQVAELVLPGDLFGFEARGVRDATAEVARDVTFVSVPRARAEALIDGDPSLSRAFREVACGRLRQARMRLHRLGHMSAVERVASFLLEMTDRSPPPPGAPVGAPARIIELFITRGDMADYLGLTSETVSRAFTELRRRGAVATLARRSFRLVNRSLLIRAGATVSST